MKPGPGNLQTISLLSAWEHFNCLRVVCSRGSIVQDLYRQKQGIDSGRRQTGNAMNDVYLWNILALFTYTHADKIAPDAS